MSHHRVPPPLYSCTQVLTDGKLSGFVNGPLNPLLTNTLQQKPLTTCCLAAACRRPNFSSTTQLCVYIATDPTHTLAAKTPLASRACSAAGLVCHHACRPPSGVTARRFRRLAGGPDP